MSDKTEIANQFNSYFTNITSSVDLGDVPENPNWDYISDFVSSRLPTGIPLFTILFITVDYIETDLFWLPLNKAVGLDGIDGYFLKIAIPAISSTLTALFNHSISSSEFPDRLGMLPRSRLCSNKTLYLTVLVIVSKN